MSKALNTAKRIAVVNFSGNVGKSVLSAHLLKPRMPENTRLFSVESVNQGAEAEGVEVEQMRGKNFGSLIDDLMMEESAIVDVGASNVEVFVKMMQQFNGSHEEIDLFIVPVCKEIKMQADTVKIIRVLQSLGIPAKKIKVVMNKVEVDDDFESDFAALFGLKASENNFIISERLVVYYNEIFERIKNIGKSLGDISADQTNYRALLRDAPPELRTEYLGMIAAQRLAGPVNQNLDAVFRELMK